MCRNKLTKNAILDIDAKFADIQRYINGLNFLDDVTKHCFIALCIECNDEIARQIQEVKERKQ